MPHAELNGHRLYWELHGDGTPVLCMGGWGTFCHGGERDAPRALLRDHQVLLFDYRGIGESGDDPDVSPSTRLYAADAAALCDHVGLTRLHVVGMVGMGACVAQELALARPDLVASLVMTGTWARADAIWRDQLDLFRRIHLRDGFEGFQLMAAAYSFRPDFYEANRERILGPEGAWSDLRGRAEAHARLVEACIEHDTLDRLGEIAAPALVVHAGADVITGPRLTLPLERGIPNARGHAWPDAAHIIAGREQKQAFDALLKEFLAEVEHEAGETLAPTAGTTS